MSKTSHLNLTLAVVLGVVFLVINTLGLNANASNESTTGEQKVMNMDSVNWQKLKGKKIYFGHQSVGGNLIDGIHILNSKNAEADKLNIVDLNQTKEEDGFIAHSMIGENEDPLSKIKDFSKVVMSDLGGDVDIAMMKFCYVDFKTDSKLSIDEVFELYKSDLEILKKNNPDTIFVHVTAPLRTVQKGWKATVKKLIGKPVTGYQNNILRNKFNQMLVQEYGSSEPIFDLAGIEASRLDGKTESFESEGTSYLALNPEYAEDRGHLNELGKEVVAEQFLEFLTGLDK